MPKKNQSFFILKMDSERLKDFQYNVTVGLSDGRNNNEVVRLGDSAMLRELRRITGSKFSQEELNNLLATKKEIKRRIDTKDNRDALKKINSQIDNMIFFPEIISISFSDSRHYKEIMANGGITVNGSKYVRLLCGAGHARRSTVLFCKESVYSKLDYFLSCGVNPEFEINPNKYNSYYALSSSATIPVSGCKFVVVKDLEIERQIFVDYFIEKERGIDPIFEPRNVLNKFNIFDGQGLISPRQAKSWSFDLEIDWMPSSFVFRGAWLKGLLVTFDFHQLSKESRISHITDIYGDRHLIDDIDIIFSESQFKMNKGYDNIEQYILECKKRDFGWGISRMSPKKDKNRTTTTYQYIQPMNIETEEQIKEICSETVKWLKDVSGGSWLKTVLFLGGDGLENPSNNWLDMIDDPIVKALFLEPSLIDDIYVNQYLFRVIRKKIKESYMGILPIDGNYQFVACDPYAQAQHALGLNVTGILHSGQYYSEYWKKRDIWKVSCFRSPMTWRSEHLILNFVDNPLVNYWYKYQNTDIIFNIFDDTLMRLAGGDVDGDILMTTPKFTELSFYGKYKTPFYERKTTPKQKIVKDKLWESDLAGFNSRIGIITNFGTEFFCLLQDHESETKEYEHLINRLKTCNIMQNCQIDKMKGIQVFEIPNWWDKWSSVKNNMTQVELDRIALYNEILCKQRPYFMRYVYKKYNKRYRKHVEIFENLSQMRFGKSLKDTLSEENKSEIKLKFVKSFMARSPLTDNDSIMNRICHYMEKEIDNIKIQIKESNFDYRILLNPEYDISKEKVDKMSILYRRYASRKKSDFDTFEEGEPQEVDVMREIENEALETISNNELELSNLAVYVCYEKYPKRSKAFLWKFFGGEGIIQALMGKSVNKEVLIPVLDGFGDIEYLGNKYSLRRIK
jgi:hypothetical protein